MPPAVALWLGCLLVRECSLAFAVCAALLMAVVGVAVSLPRKNSTALAVIAASLLMLLAGAGVTTLRAAARTSGPLSVLAARGATVRLDAVLTGDPRVRVAPGPVRARDLLILPVRVEQVSTASQAYRLRADVLVLGRPSGWTQLLPSTRIRVFARLSPPRPGDDITAVANVRGPPEIRAPPSALQRLAGRLRQGLRDASSPLPEKERGLLPGLVDGDVSALPSSVVDDFRAAGLTHLVAVSGSNCAILLGAVLVVLGRTRLRIPVRALVLLATVGLFVLIARPSPSVLRAAAMAMIAVLALLTGRPRSVVPALAGAVIALLVINPDLAVDLGFALSVLATAGLVFLAPGWRQTLAERLPGPLGRCGCGRSGRAGGLHAAAGRRIRQRRPDGGAGELAGRSRRGAGHLARRTRHGAGPGVASCCSLVGAITGTVLLVARDGRASRRDDAVGRSGVAVGRRRARPRQSR